MNEHVKTEELIKLLTDNHDEVVRKATENEKKIEAEFAGIKSQMTDIEQRQARANRSGGGPEAFKSLGARVVESEKVKALFEAGHANRSGKKRYCRHQQRNEDCLDHL